MPVHGALLSHTGSGLCRILCPTGVVSLSSIPLALVLQILNVLLLVRESGVLLSRFDTESLAHHMFASEGLFGTILDPMDQGCFLMELLHGLATLDLSMLVGPGLGYEHGTVMGYELLLLLHHLTGLRTAFFEVDLGDLVHGLLGTRILLTAHQPESLSTCESGGCFLRSNLQLALELSVSDVQVDHTGYG
jgi:hypothetical protein